MFKPRFPVRDLPFGTQHLMEMNVDNPQTQKIFTQVQVVMTVESLKEICDRLRKLEESMVVVQAQTSVEKSVRENLERLTEEQTKFKNMTIDKHAGFQRRIVDLSDEVKALNIRLDEVQTNRRARQIVMNRKPKTNRKSK